MPKSSPIYYLFLCLVCNGLYGQSGTQHIDSLLIGIWKGNSLCQVKNSPCHDENVVYHISKSKGVDTFYIDACKLVNGAEQSMGILPFTYNRKTNQIVSTAYG